MVSRRSQDKIFIPAWPWTALVALLIACVSQSLGVCDEPGLPSRIDFGQHIRPIFTSHCTACHGGVKQAGDVSFAYRDQVLPPDGWIVEPGHPDESSLIERVIADDDEERMPPAEHGPPLSKREVQLLKQWIREGAVWTEHWAYERPRRPSEPVVKDSSWPIQPMDRFVLAKLESQGVTPSPDAAPQRWLRRVTLDLTGLPPTPADRDAFLADVGENGESAYRQVVDRLLNSNAYGERWASVWLDQMRYADSKGLGLDARRNIWKYRDWVIDAFNRDLPYDEFTIMQLAGDLLEKPTIEDLIATAAHRLTQSNEEGGTDDEEFRVAAVLDRVNTTWQAWQGVTFGCVQCHSHPYDPFRHEEYYQFAAFFNNTADTDLNEDWPLVQAPMEMDQYADAQTLDQKIDVLRHEIWQREAHALNGVDDWTPLVGMQASSNNATKVVVERNGDHEHFVTKGTVSQNTDFVLEAPLPKDLKKLTAIRFTALPHNPKTAVADSEWGFALSHVEASVMIPGQDDSVPLSFARLVIDEPEPFFDPQQSLNAKSNQGFAAYSRIHYPRQAAIILDEPAEVPEGARLQVKLKHRVKLLGAFSLITRRGHLAVSGHERFTDLLVDPTLTEQRTQLDKLSKQRAAIKSTPVPILRERPNHLSRPTHVFARGLFLTKDKQVSAGTPQSLPPLSSESPPDRLAMARWIASSENPLTARVAVNRIWSRLFGIGIVATEEDFGSSGEPPSHPKLLDFLALQFQDDYGWSMKSVLREIVLSRTYRQSAKASPSQLENDPNNRLLARGPRHRLPAEIVRDQSLAFGGLLSEKQFGPPVHPPIPDGVWKPFKASDKWETPGEDDLDRYRRSIYTYVKRSIPYPMFAAFDAPSREFCTPRRLRSNTPLQALMTLNDQTFRQCAKGLSKRMRDASDDPREQIEFGVRLVTCREPRTSEVDELMALEKSVDSKDALRRLTTVASVLLNLDEVLAK